MRLQPERPKNMGVRTSGNHGRLRWQGALWPRRVCWWLLPLRMRMTAPRIATATALAALPATPTATALTGVITAQPIAIAMATATPTATPIHEIEMKYGIAEVAACEALLFEAGTAHT